MSELDSVDRQLVSLLRHNAREPLATIAQRLGVSRATARVRLDRLVAAGIVQNFTITLGAAATSRTIRAVMLMKVEGPKADSVVRELNRIPEVVDLYSTSGQWDSIVMLETDTLQRFDLVLRQIGQIPGVQVTETSLMLASRRSAR